MTTPTPRSSAPDYAQRHMLVDQLMRGLEGVESQPIDEQTRRLSEAQRILSAVLSNDPTVNQAGLPGMEA